jgi:hypothetical protein
MEENNIASFDKLSVHQHYVEFCNISFHISFCMEPKMHINHSLIASSVRSMERSGTKKHNIFDHREPIETTFIRLRDLPLSRKNFAPFFLYCFQILFQLLNLLLFLFYNLLFLIWVSTGNTLPCKLH